MISLLRSGWPQTRGHPNSATLVLRRQAGVTWSVWSHVLEEYVERANGESLRTTGNQLLSSVSGKERGGRD